MEKLLAFVADLQRSNTSYTMDVGRSDAVMVTVVVPGERVEVEFFADGTIEIERFISSGAVRDVAESDLRRLTQND